MRSLCGVAKYSSLSTAVGTSIARLMRGLLSAPQFSILCATMLLDLPVFPYVNARDIFPVRKPKDGRANEDQE
jgi:hypothetical protein